MQRNNEQASATVFYDYGRNIDEVSLNLEVVDQVA